MLTKPYLEDIELDIIIPMWNKADYTIKCIQSIRRGTENYRIILIDNGSETEEADKVYEELSSYHTEDFIYQRNYKNLGFVKGVNIGLGLSTAKYVCMLNNDTEVPRGWAELMIEDMHHVGADIVGCISTSPLGWQGYERVFGEAVMPIESLAQLDHLNRESRSKHAGIKVLKHGAMVAFFCTIFTRDVIEKVGYLSEEYGLGFGDDDDYCMAASVAGYKIAFTTNVVVHHNHRTTFDDAFGRNKRDKMQAINLAIYKHKWNLS